MHQAGSGKINEDVNSLRKMESSKYDGSCQRTTFSETIVKKKKANLSVAFRYGMKFITPDSTYNATKNKYMIGR